MKLILIIALLFTISSCGNKEESTEYIQDSITLDSADQFQEFVNSASLDQNTPEGLGLLIKISPSTGLSKVSTCTWFLISDNIAATNSHCIPKELKNDKTLDCGDYLGGLFSTHDNSNKNHSVRYCKDILHYSEIESNKFKSPDYSFIKLNQPLDSDFYQIDRSGFEDSSLLEITKINTLQDISKSTSFNFSLHGQFEKIKCQTKMHSLFGSYYHKLSKVIPVFDESTKENCKVIGGNSGSPVINPQNPRQAMGIVFAARDTQAQSTSFHNTNLIQNISNYYNNLNSIGNLDDSQVGNVGIITNFSCIRTPVEANQIQIPNSCQNLVTLETNNRSSYFKDENDKVEESIESLLESIRDELNQNIKYEESPIYLEDTKGQYYSYRPKCIYPANEWSEVDYSMLDYNEAKKTFNTTIKNPSYTLYKKISLDRFGRLYVELNKKKAISTYKIEVLNLKNKRESTNIDVNFYYPSITNNKIEELSINYCH